MNKSESGRIGGVFGGRANTEAQREARKRNLAIGRWKKNHKGEPVPEWLLRKVGK